MRKSIVLVISLAMVSVFMISCQSGAGPDGFKTTESGLEYKFFEKNNSGVTPEESSFVSLNMTYGTLDSVMFDSQKLPQAMELPITASVHKADLYEGLKMMHIGDSAVFKCNADSVFTKLFRLPSIPPEVGDIDFIYFNVKMLNIQSQEEMQAAKEAEMEMMMNEEEVNRNTYLAENYPDAEPYPSGMYYIQTKKGNGDKPSVGDKVTVHYTGTLLDGTKFDSSVDRDKPFEFPLGQGRVIKGWDEGLANMSKGEKGVLVIPSDMGYGPGGNRGIPPYSTLIFEVELIDFSK